MGIVTVDIDVTKGASKEQIEMLEKVSKMPSTADDEFPEFTKEQLQQFKRISAERKAERQKQTVATEFHRELCIRQNRSVKATRQY